MPSTTPPIAATSSTIEVISKARRWSVRNTSPTAAGDGLKDQAHVTAAFGSPAQIGNVFLTDHLLAFEITSIVLLVAAVGGVVLGMQTTAEEDDA